MADEIPARAILVPVDFSPNSEQALVFAAELATRIDAPLAVLHVVHDPAEAPGYYAQRDPDHLGRMDDIAAEMMQEFLQRMIDAHPGLDILRQAHPRLVSGLPVTRILEAAKKINPYMVVMGSRGRTGLSHLLLGSKAEQVVRLCPAPVTIVKMPNRDE
ncbi:MAG TPA: universal stress protein [Sedimenticola sp.]|nr:universal stress protein [Sedimenticola sp.]